MSDRASQASENTQPQSWSISARLESDTINDTELAILQVTVEGTNPHALTYVYAYESLDGAWRGETPPQTDMGFAFSPPHAGSYHLTAHARAKDGTEAMDTCVLTVKSTDVLVKKRAVDPNAPAVIKVDDVSMVFNIASEQFGSLKEYFIALSRHELRFKEFRALDHISFEVRRGEAFGLVGTNGSGKSTMLKIIAGVLDASEGSCTVTGTIAPLIELGAGFDLELTATENIYLNGALLGYRKEFIDEHFDDIVEFAELEGFMDMPLKNYSSGMVARIAFAIATITEPDILIVDETLSVGDFLFQKKCERRIKELVESDNVTVLLVSHSIDLVERLCDRACWIEKGHQRMLGTTEEVCSAYKQLGASNVKR